jgi:hypothetical protein
MNIAALDIDTHPPARAQDETAIAAIRAMAGIDQSDDAILFTRHGVPPHVGWRI